MSATFRVSVSSSHVSWEGMHTFVRGKGEDKVLRNDSRHVGGQLGNAKVGHRQVSVPEYYCRSQARQTHWIVLSVKFLNETKTVPLSSSMAPVSYMHSPLKVAICDHELVGSELDEEKICVE
jgi:hypothetical protein